MVGLLSATELVPLVIAALLGGALADAADRRRLILGAEAGGLAVAAGLVASAAAWHQVWLLFALAVVSAFGFGLAVERAPCGCCWRPVVSRCMSRAR